MTDPTLQPPDEHSSEQAPEPPIQRAASPPSAAPAPGFRSFVLAGVFVVALLGAFLGGIAVDRMTLGAFQGGGTPTGGSDGEPPASVKPTGDEAFGLIREAWDLLHEEYVGRADLDDQALAHAAIDGLATGVGDEGHTSFLTPAAVAEADASLAGEYVGIGTIVDEAPGGLRIDGVFPESPADQAGLGVGDLILEVDGVPVADETPGRTADRIRGETGTSVELRIDPAGPEGPRVVRLTRRAVTIPVVDWAMVPGTTVADVRLYQFSNGAIEKVTDALRAARSAGATALVLDLRGNPGGFVDQAIGVASQFLASGDVFLTEDADGKRVPSSVRPGGVATDLPLAIIVDRSTASAAEIVASAIQEGRHVPVMGARTFGTGTVLNRFGLADGSALEIGVQRWLTPSGRALWHEGLAPDHEIALAEGVDPVSPRDLEDLGQAGLRASGDAQLLEALRILAASAG